MIADLVKAARTVRRFDESKPISRDELVQLVDMARQTPCGANRQTLRYRVVSDPAECETMFPHLAWAAALPDWSGPAAGERPTGYLIIASENESAGGDVGIAAQTIQLAAREMGYGACMMGAIQREKIKLAFKLPDELRVHLVMALGTPGETVVIEPMPADGSTAYWRSEDGVHHVPKRSLDDVLLG